MRYLADTNILSELARADPDPGVVAWAQTVSAISLSVVSVEEISFGALSNNRGCLTACRCYLFQPSRIASGRERGSTVSQVV
jgi:predicted nucleic acid-binding protein